MNDQRVQMEQSRSNDNKKMQRILGGLALLGVFICGLVGFVIYRRVSQTITNVRAVVDEVKRDFAADRAEHRNRVDENRRRELVDSAKASHAAYKEKFEFSRRFRLDRERIVANSPFPDSDGNPKLGYARAVLEDPESFAREFQTRDDYAPKLEAARTLDECQRVAAELEAKVLTIRTERYRAELQSLKANVALKLAEVKADAYCVIEVTPPISEFGKATYGAALSFDLISGMWLVSAANLGETPVLPFSQWILENAGKPRVAVVRGTERAVDYIVQSVFAENRFEGTSTDACPWRLLTAAPDESTAKAAAEEAAARLRAERKHVPESGKASDPRSVVVVRVPDAK